MMAKCKNCGEEIRWCETHKTWEHDNAEYMFPVTCMARTVAKPKEGERVKCRNCGNEIVSCRICDEYFFIGQKIKCESVEFPVKRNNHFHYDCSHIALSKVVE